MPLYKRKPFSLVERPKDLKPQELVFQVRFTKEIFRHYSEYLKRINLYRKRVWTCKATGKSNLTYEEALVSEKQAAEKIENFPKELVPVVLSEIQFSMLNLRDLANSIAAKLQGPFSEGAIAYGRKDGRMHRCKTVKVHEEVGKTQYDVAWLGSDNKITGKASLKAEELNGKKLPFTRAVLKSFIKDSTYRSFPWVLHDSFAKKHEISTSPPKELKSEISIQDGLVVCNRKRKRTDDEKDTMEANENLVQRNGNGKTEAQVIKYPIEDLLVQPSEEDQYLTERPSPCRDFCVPMECVGNLLMVWDFCTSFGRLLNLSPFSLGGFENAICHKDGTPALIVESYSALLRLLMKDNGEFSMAIENKKRKPKITAITWTEYLCDFVETSCALKLSTHVSTIKRGHYGLLDIDVKLEIFRELVAQVIETDIFREKLDEHVEERHALASTRRDEALEEGRKRRDGKEQRKAETDNKEGGVREHRPKSAVNKHNGPNGVISEKRNEKIISQENHLSGNSKNGIISEKDSKKQKVDAHEDTKNPARKALKLMKVDIKEAIETKNTSQRKEYLEREIEKRIIRTNPLGKDKHRNRYWFFRREGKIFVESSDSMQWGYYETKEELDALIGSLNPKGERERALKNQLEKNYNKITLELQKRSKEVAAHRIAVEEDAVVRRSTRVRASPRENPALAFLKYVNKWKEV